MSVAGHFKRIVAKASAYAGKKAGPISAPVLGSAARFPYGPFQFKTEVAQDAPYEIQASTDLRNWTTISQNVSLGGAADYVDSDASKFSYRFYRLVAGEERIGSANVIGYVSITLPPGFSMIANPLEAPSNTVNALFKGWPEGTGLNKFDTTLFRLTDNTIKSGKWVHPMEKLDPGEGAIFFNPTSTYKPLSFVGEVRQGSISIPIPGGFSVRASPVPQPGQVHEDLGFPITDGDVIHLFDRDKQKYVLYPYEGGKWTAGTPVVGVAESFWVAKTSPGNWTRDITIGV